MKALEQLLIHDTIVDEKSFEQTAAWLTLLSRAILDTRLAEEHERVSEAWLGAIEGFLKEGITKKEIPTDINISLEAKTLWLLCAGINQRSALKPKSLSIKMQKELIKHHIAKLRIDTEL